MIVAGATAPTKEPKSLASKTPRAPQLRAVRGVSPLLLKAHRQRTTMTASLLRTAEEK